MKNLQGFGIVKILVADAEKVYRFPIHFYAIR